MKRIYILLVFSICLSHLFAQVTLTCRNNGLLPGDSSRTHEITWVDPGNPGENQVWDYSAIQYTGKTTFRGVADDPAPGKSVLNGKPVILSEDGYDCTCISDENGFSEAGYTNAVKKMTLKYAAPVVQMKYPFSYGQQFSQPYSGIAWYNEKNRIEFTGTFTVTADAYGTLILPDRILKNVVRIKTLKQALQVSVCGSTQSTIVKYYWYAPGYRYPVLIAGTTENKYGAKDPVMVRSAWANLNQQTVGAIASVTGTSDQGDTGDNSVIVFPNPFTEQVTYNYFLRKQVPAAVELYDMSGKFNLIVEKKQLRAEGLHAGSIDAATLGLTPGVYYLRFTFDRQVFVTKIVKI